MLKRPRTSHNEDSIYKLRIAVKMNSAASTERLAHEIAIAGAVG
jgi:hypothetical protein